MMDGDDDVNDSVTFSLVYGKEKHNVTFSTSKTVLELKQHVEKLTGVPSAMSKLLYKGIAKDEKTLAEWGVSKGAKVMLVGSTLSDVMTVAAPKVVEAMASDEPEKPVKELLCQQKLHKKIIDKGPPDFALTAWRNARAALPSEPLSGMVGRGGGKLRLTFKLEADQLWIGTKERTEKVSMQSVRAIVSEPIEGHEEYHIMGIQLGPTEASRVWIYWVPAQYVDAIKETILGSS